MLFSSSALLSLLRVKILLSSILPAVGCCFAKRGGSNLSCLPHEIIVCIPVFSLGLKDFFLKIVTLLMGA